MAEQVQGFQLSSQQRRLWSLQQDGHQLATQCQVLIQGPLDLVALQRAVEATIDQHEMLRTVFRRRPGLKLPLQVVLDEGVAEWQVLDLSADPAEQQRATIAAAARAARTLPWDAEAGPLVRLLIVRCAPDQHRLVITQPALSADPWSLLGWVRVLSQRAASPATEPDEPVQYAQYAEWQHTLAEDPEAEDARLFWAEQWLAATGDLPLPFEQPGAGPAEAELSLMLPAATVAGLERLSDQWQTASQHVYQACWLALLTRLSGQSRVSTWYLADGRTDEELRETLGPFGLILPAMQQLAPTTQIADLAAQLDQSAAAMQSWLEYVGLAQQTQLADMIGFELYHLPPSWSAGALQYSVEQLYASAAPARLRLVGLHSPAELVLTWYYDPARFSAATISAFARQFHALLEAVVADPATPIGSLPLIDAAERQRLLVELNQTAAPYPDQRCFHELVAAQAARTPASVAVRCGDQQLTYAALEQRANQVAHYLGSLGVTPETRIGLCVERSCDVLVGLLGILKAGAAYVPLDRTYPAERLQFMLADAQVAAVLATGLTSALLGDGGAPVVRLDDPLIAAQPDHPPATSVTPDQLSYVIYTSGSTGRPKGAMLPHRGLVHYTTWAADAYQLARGRGALVHSPLGFDLTITGLLAPLVVGQTVLLLPEDQGIEQVSQMLQDESDLSLLKLTPSHVQMLRHLLPTAATGAARALVIGGEALQAEMVAPWRAHAPATQIVNEYGPTETVVGCCVYTVTDTLPETGGVPIGRPIANTQLYVLDDRLEPVAVGIAGELYIGGVQVGRGYLNRPALTAERFVPDLFASEPGARLYRTGDLARYTPDGTLEFLGRTDDQVKLRGFRIELPEIEAALAALPQIEQAAVVLQHEAATTDQRLVAYLVAAQAADLQAADLRAALSTTLPDYMIPAQFILLSTLPLTAHGKVDRRALATQRGQLLDAAATYVAPQNELHQTIADVWRAVLKVERVGIYDNFFDLGGHSILMAEAHVKLAAVLDRPISVLDLLRHPTVDALATFLSSSDEEQPALTEGATQRAQARRAALEQRGTRRQGQQALTAAQGSDDE